MLVSSRNQRMASPKGGLCPMHSGKGAKSIAPQGCKSTLYVLQGWRHLRVFNGIKWQAFSPQNGTRQSPAATGTHAEGNGVAGQVMHSMATAEAGSAAVEEDKPTEPLLTRPGDGVYSNISSAEIQDSSAAAPLDEDKADALQLLARQACPMQCSLAPPHTLPCQPSCFLCVLAIACA